MSDKIVLSVHDFEHVKLLVFELQQLHQRLSERGQPEADDLKRILHRFTEIRIQDDRA